MRRVGMRAATSPFAVRKMTRSWNENISSPRGPRPGVKKPSRANARTCATVNPSSRATSRVVYPFNGLQPPCASGQPWLPLASCALALEARFQRLHEIDHLRLGRLGGFLGDLVALDLLLNQVQDAAP